VEDDDTKRPKTVTVTIAEETTSVPATNILKEVKETAASQPDE
jgi:hypothetical protein